MNKIDEELDDIDIDQEILDEVASYTDEQIEDLAGFAEEVEFPDLTVYKYVNSTFFYMSYNYRT